MSVRVGTIINNQIPKYEGYTPIVVMTKSSAYGDLGPYVLKDEKGVIFENKWQFSKIYPSVPKVQVPYCRRYPKIVWEWPAQIHIKDNTIQPEYWIWRNAGMQNKDPVRYPVGYEHRKHCVGLLFENSDGNYEFCDYIASRKKLYVPEYIRLVKKQNKFQALYNRLRNGENLLICEVDGPILASLEYYQRKYNVDNNFIQQNTILANKENLQIMLNDTKHPFGHGYCLAMALQDIKLE